MDSARNRQNTIDAVAAFNAGDLERYLASYAPDATIHGLPEHLQPNVTGHREFLTQMRQSLPDFSSTIEAIVAEGDLVAARLSYNGTHEGVFRGVPPTGKRLTWDAMTFRRFNDDGLTVERWILGDNLSLLHQLGLV